ncbi:MAG: ATP-dependent DNA helicase [Nitrososphaerota archaeon]|nr:ATP-dependent DNA helicase [Nitrososphaerota archaeon]
MEFGDRFAYETFRPGQRELAERVYRGCTEGGILITEAMSGFGKTSAVLTGVLSAAEEADYKIVYACRTKRQINRVVEEIARLQVRHPFKAASMLSKYDYCLLRRHRAIPPESFGWYCTFNTSNSLCSYFMNVPLTKAFGLLVQSTLEKAPRHHELMRGAEAIHVCPYEVTRLAMVQARLIVVPYQYAFDPRAMSMLFDNGSVERKRAIIVVDEAHNLRDFYRGAGSATLSLDQVRGASREARALLMEEAAKSLSALESSLEEIITATHGWRLDKGAVVEKFRSDRGTAWLQNLAFELSASSGAAWGSVMFERRLPSLILRVGEFLSKLSSSSPSVLVKWDNYLGLVDPDPVRTTSDYLGEFGSAILVSATVSPSSVFARSIGLDPAEVRTYQASTAPTVSVRTAVDTGTSTRYRLRTPEMYSKIANRIAAVIGSTTSGVGVFAPSYSMLGAIFEMVSKRVGGRNMVSESPGLSNDQATDVFDSFRSADDSVLFAVQGGRFSEGEDFEGGAMGSIVVVGLGLPPPTPMMHAEYAFLKRAGNQDSFLMLSRLPAMRKAFQAAGRHVRSPGKKGLVFFLDERFGSSTAIDLMPTWLRSDLTIGDFSPGTIEAFSRGFWDTQTPPLPS